MPYIKQEAREHLIDYNLDVRTTGELNYMLTCVIREYMERRGLSYQVINDIVGALEGAKLEFYARVARPYEDTRRELNGDIY